MQINIFKSGKTNGVIAACLAGIGAGILPLIWVFARISDTAFAAVSSGAAVVLLLAAAVFVYLQRFYISFGLKRERKTHELFLIALLSNALLILHLFLDSLMGLDEGMSGGGIISFLLVMFVYVFLFISCIEAYTHANKIGRILLLSAAALCALSLFFGIMYALWAGSNGRASYSSYYGRGYFGPNKLICFNPFPYNFWLSLRYGTQDIFYRLYLYTVTVPFALSFLVRGATMMLPLSKQAEIKGEDMPKPKPKRLPRWAVASGLAVLFVCALLTHNYFRRPYLDLTIPREIGTTYEAFMEKHEDAEESILLSYYSLPYDYAVYLPSDSFRSDIYLFSESNEESDSVCEAIYMVRPYHRLDSIFVNMPLPNVHGYPYYVYVSVFSPDIFAAFADDYGLTYLGMTVGYYNYSNVYYSESPAAVFQNEEYRFYFISRRNYSGNWWGWGEIELDDVLIVPKPEEEGLPIPEIRIKSEAELEDLYRPLFAYQIFNGLTEIGILSPEEFAELYHLTIVYENKYTDGEPYYIVFEGDGRQYTIYLLGSEVINPFLYVMIADN